MHEAPTTTLAVLLDDLAVRYGNRPALLGEGEWLSYQDLAARANRYARWAMARGLGAGSVVCLILANRPDYAALWLGLTRAGCVVALINVNLPGAALLHSVQAARAKHLIVGGALAAALAPVVEQLSPDTRVWIQGAGADGAWPLIEPELAHQGPQPLRLAECPQPEPADRALLIYTSGTTGLPKAVNITHARILEWGLWFAGLMDAGPNDRLYNCLPMYHSVGGVVAIGAMLVRGGSVLIRERFSASGFWNDIVDHDCTVFQYIGELGRYLTQSDPHPKERQHRLRLACGNGLQASVWTALQRRFGIPHVLEFYAATEGSVSLYNCEGKPGAIGRVPPFLAHRFPVALIRCDEDGAPLRDAAGRCLACPPGTLGEAIGPVSATARMPARRFDGYTDPEATARKLLHGVFVDGDCWFRTGDLMRRDAAGYFYFVDRLGDTFRWKGENVSTTEVAAAIGNYPGVMQAVVYGILVPGHEGRAGMVAFTADARFDIGDLSRYLADVLPTYAQPLFARRCTALDATGTFKLVKSTLAEMGYGDGADPVWFNDRLVGRFVPCDAALRDSIGARRL